MDVKNMNKDEQLTWLGVYKAALPQGCGGTPWASHASMQVNYAIMAADAAVAGLRARAGKQ